MYLARKVENLLRHAEDPFLKSIFKVMLREMFNTKVNILKDYQLQGLMTALALKVDIITSARNREELIVFFYTTLESLLDPQGDDDPSEYLKKRLKGGEASFKGIKELAKEMARKAKEALPNRPSTLMLFSQNRRVSTKSFP